MTAAAAPAARSQKWAADLRGIEVEPVGRRIGERGSAHQAADDESGQHRGTPQQEAAAQEPQTPRMQPPTP